VKSAYVFLNQDTMRKIKKALLTVLFLFLK